MKKLLLAAAAILCFAQGVDAQTVTMNGGPNNTAVVNITSATTTKILTGNSARQASVALLAFVSGGAGTVQVEYGTAVTNPCDTGTVLLTGAMTVAAAEYQFGDALGSVFTIPPGKDVCIITTSSATVVGFLDYNYQSGL